MSPRAGRAASGRCRLACLLFCMLLALAPALAHAFNFDLNRAPDEQDVEMDELDHSEAPASGFQAFSLAASADELNEEEAQERGQDDDDDDDGRQGSRKRLKTDSGHVKQPSGRGLASGLWSKVRAGLPDYFDFAAFRDKFKRKYSAAESFLRQSIFLQKALDVLKSRVAFRLGKKSYLESVNKFSDRTPQEFRLLYMASAPAELIGENARAASRQQEQIRRRHQQLEQLQTDGYLPELASQSAGAGGAGGAGGEAGEAGPAEGALMSERRARQLIERMYSAEQAEGHFEQALLEELDGFNVEMASRSSLAEEARAQLPWPGALKSSQVAPDSNEPYEPAQLEGPEDALDWSRHECFHEVYEQGSSCGKCYVMAATALVEFYKCSERGPGKPAAKRKFSKDYVLECAQKWTPHTAGCAGGSPLHTLRFIAAAGIFNIRDWRQRRTRELQAAREAGLVLDALDHRCPLDRERTPAHQWGPVRVELNPKPVSAARWKEALRDGPLIASVQMPARGVDSYAGGVHDGAGCAASNAWHAMLLVGYGTDERGRRFWRFRNSFGPDWGDRGHFDLAMEVPGACLAGGVRVFREPLGQ